MNMIETAKQLLERGFSLEVGRWPDTPLQQNDQFLGMDAVGHVLIARAPVKTKG